MNRRIKAVSKLLTGLLAILLVAGVGGYAWATVTSNRVLSRTFAAHSVDFPIPFPLSEEESDESALSEGQVQALALERAVERGRHLVGARYACTECHGTDLGGGVMIDAFPIGTILGPNLTGGEGSRIAANGPAEWDRIVRHGRLPDGRPAAMPSEDFQLMSDQELSDIVAFVLSHAPVDNAVPAPKLGPIGKLPMATGQLPLSANLINSALRLPMTLVTPYAQSMTDIELRALRLYLQSIPAVSSAS